MICILIKQLLRSRVAIIVILVLLFVGSISLVMGHLSLERQQNIINQTTAYQQKHLATQLNLHEDDLGLLLYYLKFSFIKDVSPESGISIGQSDLHSNIQHVTILNLESQKYNTELINPVQQLLGSMDLSFVIIYLIPLIIIALMFDLLSSEMEGGTWNLIKIQSDSPIRYLFLKGILRFILVAVALGILFITASWCYGISLGYSFWAMIAISYAYLLFWFVLCFSIILFRLSSGANAIILLTSWLTIIILLPILFSNYVNAKYPIDDAFTMAIKQRDAYHNKWDTDKTATMDKFYNHYPQFSHYGVKEEGFSWLWYYAMQQMGDDESQEERAALYLNINNREKLSEKLSHFIPSVQVQLAMNKLASTSLADFTDFWNATTIWHEDIRLALYPKIFDDVKASEIKWEQFEPAYHHNSTTYGVSRSLLYMGLIIAIIFCASLVLNRYSLSSKN